MTRAPSRQLVDFIRKEEALRLEAYRDDGGVWTVGYGHTGPEVHKGLRISEVQAELYLSADLEWAVAAVERFCEGVPLNPNQFDALCSFVFNIGVPQFSTSSMLRLLKEHPPNYVAASAQFPLWRWVTDRKTKVRRVSRILVLRRQAERELFERPTLRLV